MKNLREYLEEQINENLIQAVLSAGRNKDGISKIKIRPIRLKGQICYQASATEGQKVLHKNYGRTELIEYVEKELAENFRQFQAQGAVTDGVVLVSKKGKMTIKQKHHEQKEKVQIQAHNRVKQYILKEGVPVPFLIDLGVMNEQGKIIHARYDKFRQINRFLEFIEDILPRLSRDREITILDFGCGKSYLTFAMYYYLHVLKEYDIRIIGLDLKSDVIHHCNELSRKYGYDKLEFLVGDIADYEGVREVDMVVTLHACDTATDFALAKAVGWNAKVILSVPCCQHELNGQMQREGAGYDKLAPILDYGLLKERFAALLTDGLRAKYLEQSGYETQVLEFVDMEHTPKNILLRAVKTNQAKQGSESQVWECRKFLGIDPMLGVLLDKGTES